MSASEEAGVRYSARESSAAFERLGAEDGQAHGGSAGNPQRSSERMQGGPLDPEATEPLADSPVPGGRFALVVSAAGASSAAGDAFDPSAQRDLGDDAGDESARTAAERAAYAARRGSDGRPTSADGGKPGEEGFRSSSYLERRAPEATETSAFGASNPNFLSRFAEAANPPAKQSPSSGVARLRARIAARRAAMRAAGSAGGEVAGAASSAAARGAAAKAAGATAGGGFAPLAAGAAAVALIALLVALVASVGILGAILGSEEDDVGELEGIEAEIAAFLLDRGFDDVHTAAILGNIANEAARDADGNIDPGVISNVDGAYSYRYERAVGMFQYTHASNSAPPYPGHGCAYCSFMDWCDREGKDWAQAQTQLEYFHIQYTASFWSRSYHITSPASYDPPKGTFVSGSRSGFEGTDDVEEATRQFCYGFEAPGVPRITDRINSAKRYLEAMRARSYVDAAVAIAADDSHGYSMSRRTLNPDVDCSSLVYYALLMSGYTTDQIGSYPFTTATMIVQLESAGFESIPFAEAGELKEGDILVRDPLGPRGHTEIYIGDGQNVGAHSDYDGAPGDSSGSEVDIGPCGSDWEYVLRRSL